jgi:hypothetical protein
MAVVIEAGRCTGMIWGRGEIMVTEEGNEFPRTLVHRLSRCRGYQEEERKN